MCCSELVAHSVTSLLIFPVVPLMQSFAITDFVKNIHSETSRIQYNPVIELY